MIEAFLIYLPTTAIGSLYLYPFLAIIYMAHMKGADLKTPLFKNLLLIFSLSLLNFIYNYFWGHIDSSTSGSFIALFPYAAFFFFSYFIAKFMRREILKGILTLLMIEISVATFEYAMGVSSFFGEMTNGFGVGAGGEDVLYNRRVFGFSNNSSALAMKCLIGLIIVYYIKPPRSYFYLTGIVIGLFVTFNRTCILSSMPLLIYFYINITNKYKRNKWCIHIAVSVLILSSLGFIVNQMMRGSESLDIGLLTSNRNVVYATFWEFWKSHFWMGNGSVKLWLDIYSDGRHFHAHNSFLMCFASNGFIIGLLYILMIITNIRKSNALPLLCLILSSFLQYSFLWGLSLGDIVLFVLILYPQRIEQNTRCVRV